MPTLLLLAMLAAAPPADRVTDARARRGAELQALFAAAGVPFPAPRLFLRAHKHERELELWAGGRKGPLTRVHVFPICAASGALGPKRRRGDGQVPEGLYRVAILNPRSQFHLSLGLDYPNRADRLRSRGEDPGGDIFLHGACVSIGCLALEDGPIELLYLAVADTRARFGTDVPVLLLPRRMDAQGRAALAPQARTDRSLAALWSQLARLDAAFEATHQPPRARVEAGTGAYLLEGAPGRRPGDASRGRGGGGR